MVDVFKGALNIDRQLLRDYLDFLLNTDARFNYERNFSVNYFECADEFKVTEHEIHALMFYETGTNENGVPYGELGELGNNVKPQTEASTFC